MTTHVLFLCTGNSARSILAEALLTAQGSGWRGHSAGSHPVGRVNPGALRFLAAAGLPTGGLSSKSWDVFAAPGAPVIDLVITVCDAAAGETCPIWPGQPARAHWGLPDPAAVQGPDAQVDAAFAATAQSLSSRIVALLALGPARPADADWRVAVRQTGA
jgi:arsenate reductase (thioredoxin)